MSRRFLLIAAIAGMIFAGGHAFAQAGGSGLISTGAAQQYGLKRAWYTQLQVDRSRGRVDHIVQHVSSTRAHTVYEISYDNTKELFSDRHVDPFGKPIGQEKAEKIANERLAKLKADGLDPQFVTRVIPEITLYVSTDRGIVQAIDGETGQSRWAMPLGKRDHVNLAPAANDEFVAVVNGAKLVIVDNRTGKMIWERRLRGAPGAGPAMSDTMVFVPMVDGAVESFDLILDNNRTGPGVMFSHGHCMIQPTITGSYIAWPTDRGHLNVGLASRTQIQYRLETNGSIVSPATYLYPKLFVSSLDGYVYCLEEASGDILWPFSTGEEISHSPIPIGDAVYVITDDGTLYRVSNEFGKEQWRTPHIKQFIAASKERVYCLSDLDRLVILDAKSGGRIANLPTDQLKWDLKLVNRQTDRMFVGTKAGVLQCLHESNLDFPIFHLGDKQLVQRDRKIARDAADDAAAEKPDDDAPADVGGGKPADPFGGGARPDPFGGGKSDGGATPAPAGGGKPSDPFGGGARPDPFGGM